MTKTLKYFPGIEPIVTVWAKRGTMEHIQLLFEMPSRGTGTKPATPDRRPTI